MNIIILFSILLIFIILMTGMFLIDKSERFAKTIEKILKIEIIINKNNKKN